MSEPAPAPVRDDRGPAPTLCLRLDGEPVGGALRESIAGVRLVQRACLPAQLVVDLEGFADDLPRPVATGAAATLEPASAGAAAAPLFRGIVTAVEQEIGADRRWRRQIRAHDGLHRLQRQRRPHRLDAGTLDAAARALLAPHGLTADGWPARAIPELLLGHGADDLELLRRLAVARGVYFHASGERVRGFALDGDGDGDAAPVDLAERLVSLRHERNDLAAWQHRRVVAWDLLTLETSAHDHGGAGDGGEAAGFGRLREGDADDRSRARALEDAQRAERVSGVSDGDPRLRPGVRVRLQHPDLETTVTTTLLEVVHRLDPALGYVTEFTNAPPLEQEDAGLELAFGVVCEVDDDAASRARLALPWLDDLETGWLPVVVAGAGADKGCVALPEVGDHVACLLYAANPARGMILGGLYAEAEVPTERRRAGRDRAFVVRTRRGQRLRLDDAGGRAELRNRDGSRLELTPGGVRLHADCDLDLAAPGKRITIRAARIDFEEA